MTPLARLRRQEYTGPNRCWPCTLLNGGILVVLSVTVGVVSLPAAAIVAVVGAAVIWLRGYLIPYTPVLGPRIAEVLPGDVFGHDASTDGLDDLHSAPADGDAVLEALIDAGVVVVDGERLGLDEGFASAWADRMDELAAAPAERLANQATAAARDVESARIEDTGDETFLVVSGGGATAWLRRPVAIAEVGAAQALADTDLPVASRDLAAHALSAFLETCPVCGTDLVEGPADDCCGHTVPDLGHEPPDVLACETCGVAFYTFDAPETADA